VFLGALMGGSLGFLWFNAHPAQVFMGDTGSLGIGGALGTVAILLKAEFLLAIIGGVFVAESLSVLIQTGVFRWHKRTRGREYAEANRVFRMAPLHHHFEKLGWAETTVVTRFYILGILCAMVALATSNCADARLWRRTAKSPSWFG
jgi:phospho-N-acetylmuramoyl-pentapeptide-transferase